MSKARNRSLVAGFTDYTGVGLPDIIEHMKVWRDNTNQCITKLKGHKNKVMLLRVSLMSQTTSAFTLTIS